MSRRRMVFACAPESEVELRHAVVLGESLRRFGGAHAQSTFWILTADPGATAAGGLRTRIAAAALAVVPFEMPDTAWRLPFTTKTAGAAIAEAAARADRAGLLVWMDCGSLMLQPPEGLVLAAHHAMGYRPVDHTLIGSRWTEPADRFWQAIYQRCGVPAGSMFAMPATVDQQVLRPYFNAGLMVVRPERGVFTGWLERFRELQADAAFAPYLTQNTYRVFFHQAVLAGMALSILAPAELQLLSPRISYPLHMHAMYPAAGRLAALDDAVTVRHEGLFDEPGWQASAGIAVSAELAGWIAERMAF